MIDEKGRLFGKVNLIDLIIVIIIIAALVFLGVKFLGPESTAANTQKAVVSFYYEECPNYVADQLKAGDSVWDSGDNVTIGTVKDWTTADSVTYLLDDNGNTVQTSKDGYCALTLRCEAEGVIGEHGITINGTLYGVGHTLTMYAGEAKLYLKVSGIEPAE
ncbi:MAG: DUF4330 domain-containing protein [Clostridia bacterium]|nr:DUF4330 domain-containing protein [Clostridia bacterium]NCC69070.1 DUF4330 domain-containing protein [Clostridia bacterium]